MGCKQGEHKSKRPVIASSPPPSPPQEGTFALGHELNIEYLAPGTWYTGRIPCTGHYGCRMLIRSAWCCLLCSTSPRLRRGYTLTVNLLPGFWPWCLKPTTRTLTLTLTRTLWGDQCLDAVACEGSRLIRPARMLCLKGL